MSHPHTVALRVVLHTDGVGETRLAEGMKKARDRVLAVLPEAVKVEVIDGDCGKLDDVMSYSDE